MKTLKEPVSLKDIAEKIGVSSMTVSRVVNGTGAVKKDTRIKILNAIKQMGYRKDVFASINAQKRKGIKKKKRVTINFPIAYFHEKEFFNFFSSINIKLISELQAMKIDYSIIHADGEKEISDIDAIIDSDIVVHCGKLAQNSYKAIKELNPEARHISICFHMDDMSSIHPDDSNGGKLAAEYFHDRGHENIMCLTIKGDASNHERCASFISNMRSLNVNAKIDELSHSCKDRSREIPEIRNLLDEYFRQNRPSGIFTPNGYNTMIVYKYLMDRGFKIPGEIGLLGYDDLDFYDFIENPLSRIMFSRDAVAKTTTTIIEAILEKRIETQTISLIPVKLIDKKSVIHIDNMNIKRGEM
jgi:LacI family transcriptional regulator